jgi:SAM-dependent methyltransferase
MTDFIKEVFLPKYYNKLDKRKETFNQMFRYLESLEKDSYTIIETGICRIEDNFAGDGMSSLMFDDFINYYDGRFTTIDINPKNVEFAKSKLSTKAEVICSDSVSKLYELSKDESIKQIDLVYLDSYDLDWNDPHPSAMHHIKELLAIMPKLKSGTLLVIDDNQKDAGKGKYVSEFMKNIGKDYFFNEYQTAWII